MKVACSTQSPSQVTRASIAPGVVLPRQPSDASGRAKAIVAARKLAAIEWPKTIIVAGSPP